MWLKVDECNKIVGKKVEKFEENFRIISQMNLLL